MNIIIILSIVWYLIGVLSFIYWWTKDHDLTVKDLVVCFFMALLGPVMFIVGFSELSSGSKILIKRIK